MEGEDRENSSEGASDSELCYLGTNDDDDDDNFFESGNMPKLQFRKNISQARWNDEMGMSEVIENKGSMWRTMGIVRGGKIYCSIEETLFLAERGELNLSHADESLVPLKDIYKKIAEGKSGCCWDSFQVYRHLRSLGYIVGRHCIPWTMKSNKSNSVLVDGNPEIEDPNKILEEKNFIHAFRNMGISELRPAFDVYPPSSKFRKSSPGVPSFVLCIISGEPPSEQEIKDLERRFDGIHLKLCHVEQGQVSFFSFNKVDLPLLP